MAETFHKSTWAQVRDGDVVLMPWSSLDKIVEAKVLNIRSSKSNFDRKLLIYADIDVVEQKLFGWCFDPDKVAYIKSRF